MYFLVFKKKSFSPAFSLIVRCNSQYINDKKMFNVKIAFRHTENIVKS